MAKSEKLKQTHAAQVIAAEKEFTAYKDFIVKEFVDEFGGSYQTAEGLKDVWRTVFIYTPKCEKFLIKKTILFICMLSTKNRDFKSPVFFKNLIGKISEYLSSYIAKKGESKHNCAQYLRNIFTQNSHVKSRIEEYVSYNKKIRNDKSEIYGRNSLGLGSR